MKNVILFLLLVCAGTARGQSLKDLLYRGKLKNDSNTVIRKTDDLSTKIDTAQKKPAVTEKARTSVLPADSAKLVGVAGEPSKVAAAPVAKSDGEVAEDEAGTPAAAKSNNKILKEYTDSLISALQTDVLSSKKVKKGTYYFIVEYEIGTSGEVSINNVTASPENTFLQDQVKSILMAAPPQLNPALDSFNKPRKVKRKHSFTITKD